MAQQATDLRGMIKLALMIFAFVVVGFVATLELTAEGRKGCRLMPGFCKTAGSAPPPQPLEQLNRKNTRTKFELIARE